MTYETSSRKTASKGFEKMREFNKLFIVALPRCATVSMSQAVGQLGVSTAHLGKIYGDHGLEHNDPQRLLRMYDQIAAGDYRLDILEECRGLADYPVCAFDVLRQLDNAYPGSLFINVRRDRSIQKWLQSVERQFVGLQLLTTGKTATPESQRFMKVMLAFREMTFGQTAFAPEVYRAAYEQYQRNITNYFADRSEDILEFEDVTELNQAGFGKLAEFLQIDAPESDFPCNNSHSQGPYAAFQQALESGEIESLTGITVDLLK